MSLVIENAWWVWGAAVVAALGLLLGFLARGRSGRWRTACVGLPVAAALMAALAMSGLGVRWNPAARGVVILLDLSPSTRVSPWRGVGGGAWVRTLAELRLGREREVTVVGFGGASGPRVLLDRVKVGDAARWPAEWAVSGERVGSDVAGALAWRSAEEARGETAVRPRWVITDGLVTGVEKTQGLQSLGFELGWTKVLPGQVDVGVVEVGVKGTQRGVDVWARVRATGKSQAKVTFSRDGKVVEKLDVPFADDAARWLNFHDGDAAEAAHRYEVALVREGGADPWPENDRGAVLWVPETAAARVLVVGTERAGDLGSQVVAPGHFPGNVGQLLAEGWQVIVLNDLPMSLDGTGSATTAPAGGLLSGQSLQVIDQFVRETGGGLVIVGGKRAFGPGHYAEAGWERGSLEALSPVLSQPHDRPAARVIFLLDASGSMNEVAGSRNPEQKFRLVARGVEQAMELLKDQDRVTVLTFSDHAEKIASGTKGELLGDEASQNVLRQRLDRVRPTGNTVPDTALEELGAALAVKDPETEGGSVMVVLLTDGEIPQMDAAKWKAALAKGGAKFTVVAPPPAAEGSVLGALAKDVGATWLATEDAAEWAVLLKRAVAKEITGRAMRTAVPWKSEDSPLTGITREWIEVWKKPEARLMVSGEGGRTLGAVAQRGLGKVAAVAMKDESAGGAAFGELMRRVVKEVMPAAGDRRFTVWAKRGTEGWVIGADGVEGGKFLDGQRLKVRVLGMGPGESERVLEMPQTGPGRYETRVENGEAFVAVIVREGEERSATTQATAGVDSGGQLVGRVSPGRTEVGEWPASVERAEMPGEAEMLSTEDVDKGQWSPQIVGWRSSFAWGLWVAAALLALASLWVRRGPGGAGV